MQQLRLAAGAKIPADWLGRAEVERGAGHRPELARWNQGGVDRRIGVGGDHQFVIHRRARTFAGQVPIGVVAQVDDGRRIGAGAVFNRQAAIAFERVGGGDRQRAGIALVAVGADVAQGGAIRLGLDHVPDHLVEATGAAVQAVGAIVGGHAVFASIQREPAAGDAIGEAPDDGAEILRLGQRGLQRRVAQHHVGVLAVAIRHFQRMQRRAQRQYARLHAAAVAQQDGFDLRAVRQRADDRALLRARRCGDRERQRTHATNCHPLAKQHRS